MAYETLHQQNIYSGKIIDVYKNEVLLPDGNSAEMEIVLHKECCAVLPVQDDKIIFVRQYRYPINDFSLEIPAGIMEDGESPEECARRELQEETGLIAKKLSFMFKMYTAIGFCNELINVFLADSFDIGKQNFDPDEFITIEKYSLDQAKLMISNGQITDSKTMSAIFSYACCK